MRVDENGRYYLTEEEKEKLREKSKGRSLAEMNPELASQWNYELNGDLEPDMVTANSGFTVFWIYPYDDSKTGHHDFVWDAKIKDRNKSSGCPFLTGHRIWKGFNDLETLYPELAKQWHPNKNGNYTPDKATTNNCKIVWWYLPYLDLRTGILHHFEWKDSIDNRVKGKGCPFLAKSNAQLWRGFNDLASVNPIIAAQWHPTKNGDLKPSDIVAKSVKKAWWYLPYDDPKTGKHFDFEWMSIIAERNNGVGCPFLTNTAIWKGFNDLATTNPQLAAEWHPTKNGKLTPSDVMANSNKKVWWYLPYDDPKTGKHHDYKWIASIAHRNAGQGCPFLQKSKGENLIDEQLSNLHQNYIMHYKIPTCKYKSLLSFDFYLQDGNIAIEYDGQQHFASYQYFGGNKVFKENVERDNVKTNYCFNNGIYLLRIPYIYDAVANKKEICKFVIDFIKTKQVPQEIIDFYSQFSFSDYGKILQKQNP